MAADDGARVSGGTGIEELRICGLRRNSFQRRGAVWDINRLENLRREY